MGVAPTAAQREKRDCNQYPNGILSCCNGDKRQRQRTLNASTLHHCLTHLSPISTSSLASLPLSRSPYNSCHVSIHSSPPSLPLLFRPHLSPTFHQPSQPHLSLPKPPHPHPVLPSIKSLSTLFTRNPSAHPKQFQLNTKVVPSPRFGCQVVLRGLRQTRGRFPH